MEHAIGEHLIIDIWEASNTANLEFISNLLREASEIVGATVLKIDLHEFPGGGVTGVALLAESHMSIHTWPELQFAAIDVFVCGTMDPYKAIPLLEKGFATKKLKITALKRGT
jgi:S-adenosylmethionine decarboxylase